MDVTARPGGLVRFPARKLGSASPFAAATLHQSSFVATLFVFIVRPHAPTSSQGPPNPPQTANQSSLAPSLAQKCEQFVHKKCEQFVHRTTTVGGYGAGGANISFRIDRISSIASFSRLMNSFSSSWSAVAFTEMSANLDGNRIDVSSQDKAE